MEAWLLNPCLVPKLTNPCLVPKFTISIPFSLTPSRKRKQSLEVPYRKLNLCGTGKTSTARQVASMAGGLTMASASTSVSPPTGSCSYQIFLNHRCPDTKNTFTSDFYHRLVSHGFRVFWDKKEMQVGDTLTPQIQDAVKAASLHVAVFSTGYANSTWCLQELLLMVESKKPIIPVFHGVQPTDLRRTQGEGVYAQALHNLENKRTYDSQPRHDSTTIEKWRTALSTVAEISGLELEKFNGDEGELLDTVVDSVLKKLERTRLDVAEHPIGLDEKGES